MVHTYEKIAVDAFFQFRYESYSDSQMRCLPNGIEKTFEVPLIM